MEWLGETVDALSVNPVSSGFTSGAALTPDS